MRPPRHDRKYERKTTAARLELCRGTFLERVVVSVKARFNIAIFLEERTLGSDVARNNDQIDIGSRDLGPISDPGI